MLAKLTSKNQLTLPSAVVSQFVGVEHYDVSTEGDSIVLRPLRRSRSDEVRAKLAALSLSDSDIVKAVNWARRSRK